MTSVYLINVGANTGHRGEARSPIFDDGTWVYVSFPTKKDHGQEYSDEARPFVRRPDACSTHADPRWDDLSYGDDCDNPRASTLRRVTKGDILLFWGLLWTHRGEGWCGFSGEQGWYLFGALRVEEIALRSLQDISEPNRQRAGRNPHFKKPDDHLKPDHRVLLGSRPYSTRFGKAVDLDVKNPEGLMYKAFGSAKGRLFALDEKPFWGSSLRPCREIWDLTDPVGRGRAEIVRKAIKARAGFDMLRDL